MILIKIGSSPTSNVVVNHPSVSPNHLEIVQDDQGAFLLTDLNSLYGTYVNGYRIQGVVQLRTTDMVNAGEVPLPWQSYFMYQAPTPTQQPVVPPVAGIPVQPQYGANANPQTPPATPYADAFLAPKKPVNKKKVFAIVGGSLLAVLLLIAGLIYWYTRPSFEHLKFIPSNAFMVTSINFKSLAGKVDVEKMKKLEFFVDMQDQAKERNQALSKAMGDPMTCGLDIFSQPYGFVCVDKGDYMRFSGGIVFAIKNEEDFHRFVARMAREGEEIKSSDDFNYLKLDGSSCVAWNKKGGIFFISERSNSRKENYCRSLFEQKEEESILSVASFDKFQKATYDIGIFMNYDAMRNFPGVNMPDYLKGTSSLVTINFNEAKLSYSSEFFPSPTATTPPPSMLAKKGISDDLKSAIPGNSLGVASMSIDVKALYDYLDKDPNVSPALDEIARNLKVSRKDLSTIVSGDLFGALVDFKEKPYQRMNMVYDYETYDYSYSTVTDTTMFSTYLFGATIKNPTVMENILGQANLRDTTGGIRYYNTYFNSLNFYIAKHGSNYFLSNDFDMATQMASTGKATTPVAGKMAEIITLDPLYSYFNMNLKKYPACVPKYLKETMSRREYRDFETVSNIFDYMDLQGDGVKQSMDIYFTEKGNCLNTFLNLGNDLYLNHNNH